MPTELAVLGLSVILLVVHIMIQGQIATRDHGLQWNAGPRDGDNAPASPLAGRAARALSNYQETYPAFIALALGLTLTGQTGGIAAIGAITWLVARILYMPLYLLGVAYARSLVWITAMLGLLLMLVRFF
jgi:uncharacterized MAPEG superfamily protein